MPSANKCQRWLARSSTLLVPGLGEGQMEALVRLETFWPACFRGGTLPQVCFKNGSSKMGDSLLLSLQTTPKGCLLPQTTDAF